MSVTSDSETFDDIRGVVLDLDGTVYRGEGAIPGAAEAVAALRERGISVCFCSNNPTKTPAEYVDRLAGMGIDADESAVLPASTVTRDYLRDSHPGEPTYLLGSDSLADYLRESGQRLVDDPRAASVFVASWDERFDYGDMRDALAGIDDDTAFLGTDPDRTIPAAEGFVPGSGAIIGAVARTVGREPDRVLGKPAPETAEDALARLGVPAERCLVVGDRLDTDLRMGADHGMATALVLTGVSTRADAAGSAVDPDAVLDSLADLPALLD
ncbi:HAD-IIA family hydrolase [Halosimplex halophilum]|uniref:HAD-IIA family hydrolase n=1 Tax=Halosimplex halophilum TaxID=2559572 RepID=UPI00107F145F|nr:HAD-IIA family hydrolase [Halosimplex halophilum]